MIKCSWTSGECYNNMWYWIDTNMNGNTNLVLVSLSSTMLIYYTCEPVWWLFWAVHDEQLTMATTTTSISDNDKSAG